MMMFNNPLQVIQAVQNGANPNQIVAQLMQQNPAVRMAAQFMNGKTPQQIQREVYQMARQSGVDLNALAQQLGVPLPK